MERFHVIDDAHVILRGKRGIYRQAKVYRRGAHVFAGVGGGFVRLLGRSTTTNPDVSWLELEADGVALGRSGEPVYREPRGAVAA